MPADEYVAWIAAFVKARAELPRITKDSDVKIQTTGGGSFGYSYAALPDILDKVTPTLKANGLVLVQSVTGDGDVVAVSTRIYHKAGWVESFGPLALKVTGDAKAAGSAITYARRYALCAALGIAPDEDDDGAAASVPEPKEVSPWEWLWGESKVFKRWTPEQRREKAQAGLEAYAFKGFDTMDTAHTVLEWMRVQYQAEEDASQDELPL